MSFRSLALTVIVVLLAACGGEEPSATPDPMAERRSEVLVDPAWIVDNMDNPDVVLIDIAESEAAWLDGHIPGAHFLNWRTDISDPAQMQNFNVLSKERFETLMSQFGATPDSIVVLYDDASTRLAARVWWTMKYYGHDQLRILDGGRNAWQRAGLEYSADPVQATQSAYVVESVNEQYLADMAFINENLREPSFTLVDARIQPEYTGDQPGRVFSSGIEHRNVGHVYGAQNVPWSANFNEDGTFKTYSELLGLYEPHDVSSEKTVVTYCNVGIQGSSPWFVLKELLGYDDVRLYDSSMAEYANIDDNILVTGMHCM